MTEQDDESRRSVVPKMIGGAVAAGFGVRLDPGAAIVLGALGSQFEELAERCWAELKPQKRMPGHMLDSAARKLRCDSDQLATLTTRSDETKLMTAVAMEAAVRTTWPNQVVALGKLLADGLIADGDAVLTPQRALDAMVNLGRLDVSLLDLLVRYWPSMSFADPATPEFLPLGSCRDAQGSWTVGPREWREDLIVVVRPELGQVLPGVTGGIARHGLAVQRDRTPELLEEVNRELQRQIQQATRARGPAQSAGSMTIDAILNRPQERTWMPTYLGEIVIGYYIEAAQQHELEAAQPS